MHEDTTGSIHEHLGTHGSIWRIVKDKHDRAATGTSVAHPMPLRASLHFTQKVPLGARLHFTETRATQGAFTLCTSKATQGGLHFAHAIVFTSSRRHASEQKFLLAIV